MQHNLLKSGRDLDLRSNIKNDFLSSLLTLFDAYLSNKHNGDGLILVVQ